MMNQKHDEVDYDALAARLTDPAIPLEPVGKALRGAEAAAAGRAFLLREYGSEAAVLEAMRPGRPQVGQSRGESPSVKTRLPLQEADALEELARRKNTTKSDLVRLGVHRLLVAEGMLREG
jgi:hypothetical protein